MDWDTAGIAAAVTRLRSRMTPLLPGGRVIRKDGAVAIITGAPSPAFNGVWCEGGDVPAASLEALLDEVAGTGLPFFAESPTASRSLLAKLAAGRGMAPGGQTPVMALEMAAAVGSRARPVPEGMTIRQLEPGEASLHIRLSSAVFGIPEDLLRRVLVEEAFTRDWLRCYVAETDGQPVATGLAVTEGSYTAISNMGTLPAFRGNGLASAIAALAMADGRAAGARYCCLRATQDGLGVYRALGFEVVEEWSSWISPVAAGTGASA
jgi:GNAT superfamily N-acetyltransferase